jgi:voltage-gated potassium channel
MKKSVVLILISFCMLIAFGIVGYEWIEGWGLAESLYMTMITITTTGYQEVHPLSFEGRMFTIVLLCAGVATLAFTTHILITEFMSIDFKNFRRQKMKKKISSLSGHTIVCGFGRMGQNICRELEKNGIHFVVVDKTEDNFENVPPHYLWLHGDATSDQLLIDAGVERAIMLASMVDSDADSLYLTLAARSLNANLKIISRASDESAKIKLLRAGADEVVRPLLLSSQKVAQIMLSEDFHIPEFEEQKELCAEKRTLTEFPDWIGKSVNDVERQVHQRVLALVAKDGQILLRSEINRVFNEGDTLLFAGAAQKEWPTLKLAV